MKSDFIPLTHFEYSEKNFQKEHKVIFEGQEYIIKLGKIIKDTDLLLIIFHKLDNPSTTYFDYFLLNDLYKISKYFKLFDSIDETIENIYQILITQKSSLISIENEKVKISLEVNKIINGKDKITLYLNYKSKLELIYKFNCEINQLKEIIKKLENEMNLKDELIKNLSNKIYKIEKDNENLLKMNNDIIKRLENLENTKNINFNFESNIIKNKSDLNFVIKQIYINNMIETNKNCYLNLIYRATKDGDDYKIYHQKTNNISDTLTLIRTKKGIIFCGFTHIKISSCTGENFEDEKAFIFSLDFHKIYLPQKGHCSKHSNDNYGPIFGNNEKCQYPILIEGSNFLIEKIIEHVK